MRVYRQFLDDGAPATFVERVASSYGIAALERLAASGGFEHRRAAVLALTMLGDFSSNSVVAQALHDQDRGVRMLAENGIEQLWSRAGNANQQLRLRRIKRLNQGGLFEQALTSAEELCEQAPSFGEAWNQLSICRFFLGLIEDSIYSCWQALSANPYQFESAIGLGHAYLELDERQSAIECYQQAVDLNPNLESIRIQVVKLQG